MSLNRVIIAISFEGLTDFFRSKGWIEDHEIVTSVQHDTECDAAKFFVTSTTSHSDGAREYSVPINRHVLKSADLVGARATA